MPIAILGTGRSGTSMVARMLNLCGLYMGEQDEMRDARLNPSMNPKGYWEHREIRSLMDRLFDHLGGTWENPPLLVNGWEYDSDIEPFYVEATEIVARHFGGRGEWAWKLPKASVTIAFWQRVMPDLRFIVCVRNPLDFAQSLGRHIPVSQTHLFAMWQFYNYSILTSTDPARRLITFYEDYFPHYQAGLSPLLDFSGLSHPVANDEVDQRLQSFHDQRLKHHSSTLQDVLADPDVPYVTQQLYLEMMSADASASDLPMLGYRDMLLPLLQRALVGEGALDGTRSVGRSRHEKQERAPQKLRVGRGVRLDFLRNVAGMMGLYAAKPKTLP